MTKSSAPRLARKKNPSGKWVAIIHSAISRMPRRMIVSDDGPIDIAGHVGLGEDGFALDYEHLIRDQEGNVSPATMREMIARFHSIDPATIPDDRCAMVCKKTALVKNLVHADPEFDIDEEHHVRAWEHGVKCFDKHDGMKFLTRHHVVINGVLEGHVWENELPEELQGVCFRDHHDEWADKQIGDPVNVPEEIGELPTDNTQVL